MEDLAVLLVERVPPAGGEQLHLGPVGRTRTPGQVGNPAAGQVDRPFTPSWPLLYRDRWERETPSMPLVDDIAEPDLPRARRALEDVLAFDVNEEEQEELLRREVECDRGEVIGAAALLGQLRGRRA